MSGSVALREATVNRLAGALAAGFLLIGLALAAGGLCLASRTSAFLERAKAARGVVERIDATVWRGNDGSRSTRYSPVVRFQTDTGAVQLIRGEGSWWAEECAVGQVVEVRYEASRPADGVVVTFRALWFGSTVLLGFGILFILAGGGAGGYLWQRAHGLEELRRNGTRIRAAIQSITRNDALTVNGRSPWHIACRWVDPVARQAYIFESDTVWFDPTPYVHGEEITVYVDPRNPSRHWVDTSFLPKLAK